MQRRRAEPDASRAQGRDGGVTFVEGATVRDQEAHDARGPPHDLCPGDSIRSRATRSSRKDVQKALDLFEPLLPFFSAGGARVSLSATAAHFDRAAADLEGFARPLWGLAPYAAGGGQFAHWPLYAKGLANGTDPAHPEYWGSVGDRDQRMVELAAIGFSLCLVPEHLWEPLDERARRNVATYLLEARPHEFADNNWKFFRVMIDLGLERVGVEFDRSLTETYLRELEAFYLGDGWYRDGNVPRVDHYIPVRDALLRPDLCAARAQRTASGRRGFANGRGCLHRISGTGSPMMAAPSPSDAA